MRKNMPPEALTGPFAQQQKMMLYLFPIIFAVGGINFPIGVLIYWLASNLWTMGQQFYVIRRNPAPGTPAYEAWEERRKEKQARKAARRHSGATDVALESGASGNGAGPSGNGAEPQGRRPSRRLRRPPRWCGSSRGSRPGRSASTEFTTTPARSRPQLAQLPPGHVTRGIALPSPGGGT